MSKSRMVAEHAVKFYRKHLQSDFLPEPLRKHHYAQSLWIQGRLIGRQDPHLALSLFLEAWQARPLDLRYGAYAMRAWMMALCRQS